MELYERNALPLACAVVDVDNFKFYNDNYGHQGGDAVLRCLERVYRADDLVARYGGDEFVMLLGRDVEDAIEVAERVREKVEFECLAQEETSLGGSLTVSVGVASLGEDTATLQQLIRAADEELYRAKVAGKNRVEDGGRR